MTPRVIATLVAKDLTLYFRDRFFAIITVLGLVAYIALYFVMPSSVDESFDIGVFAEGGASAFVDMGMPGVAFTEIDSLETLQDDVEDGDVLAGIALDADGAVTLYSASTISDAARDSVEALIGGMFAGDLPVTIRQEVIGTDYAGEQIPLRDRVVPLFAVFVLFVEVLGLASLIADEVENRTIRALMVTPMNVGGLFISKGIFGVGLAFSQAAILMLVTGGLQSQPLLILTALLLGSIMVTGIAFLIAAFSRDLMSVVSWGMLAMIVLTVPALTVLFPGPVSDWIRLIPTHYLVDSVDQVANFGAGWSDVAGNFAVLIAASGILLTLGAGVLRRKLYES